MSVEEYIWEVIWSGSDIIVIYFIIKGLYIYFIDVVCSEDENFVWWRDDNAEGE